MLITILLSTAAALACWLGQGCMVIWSDQVLVVTLFKTVDANDIDLIAEPNYIQIGSGKSKTKNDSIEAIIPAVGIIKTTGEKKSA